MTTISLPSKLSHLLTDVGYLTIELHYREKSWKSRSRRWNALRKTAWKVGPRQKGRGLPIPADIANVPIWVEWDQDVGDWRNTGSNENNRYARVLTPRWQD